MRTDGPKTREPTVAKKWSPSNLLSVAKVVSFESPVCGQRDCTRERRKALSPGCYAIFHVTKRQREGVIYISLFHFHLEKKREVLLASFYDAKS